jgi:hypothetical protein
MTEQKGSQVFDFLTFTSFFTLIHPSMDKRDPNETKQDEKLINKSLKDLQNNPFPLPLPNLTGIGRKDSF